MPKKIRWFSTILLVTALLIVACGQAAPASNEQVLSEAPQNQNLQPPIRQEGAQPTSTVDAGGVTPEPAQVVATSAEPTVPAPPSGAALVTPESVPPTSVPVPDEAQPTQVAVAPTAEAALPTAKPAPPTPTATTPPELLWFQSTAETDRQVLIELYRSTNGGAWTNNENWLSDKPVEEWYGVTTDGHGRVSELDLAGNGLTGTLPAKLLLIEWMESLYLEDNALTGELPTLDIPGIRTNDIHVRLSNIDISGNQLTGCVPVVVTEAIGVNAAEYGSLDPCPHPDREALEAFYNSTGGPDWTNQENWMTDAPLVQWHGVWANQHGKVIRIELYNNNLEGPIPPEVGKLEHLESLTIGGNHALVREAKKRGEDILSVLRAEKANRITGPLPEELFTIRTLTNLYLAGMGLAGQLPSMFTKMESLETLNLSHNSLEGPIPPEIGNLGTLTDLTLHGNRFTGQIPPELGQLKTLEHLSLGDNQLEGAIPGELGQLTSVKRLSLDRNQLSGEIPPELGGMEQLTFLSLSRNNLSGAIPSELGNLAALTDEEHEHFEHISEHSHLDFSDNQLTGEIPRALGNLVGLASLTLNTNQLTGEIPRQLAKLKSLGWLDLGNNMLTGGLPHQLAEMQSLRSLNVENNQLAGIIPEGFGKRGDFRLNTKGNNFDN